jgi:hypothetical protein
MMEIWRETLRRRPVWVWLPRAAAVAQAAALSPITGPARLEFLTPEAVRSSFVSFRYSSAKAESALGVRFRPAEQAWRETLLAEEAAWIAKRSRGRRSNT